MNIDKYRVQVAFMANMPASASPLNPDELHIYQEAAEGTLVALFPGDAVHAIPQFEHSGMNEVAYEVVFANRRTHWMGDCERIVRQLRKSEATFYVRVDALMFHDSQVDTRSTWMILGTAKYYANEGTTTETLLPTNAITTIISYTPAGQDAVYASNVLHETIRNSLHMLNKPESVFRIYRYGEQHEIKL